MNGRQAWLPLELVLEGFLDMMDQGKALAVDSSYDGEQGRIEPWIMPSYTACDLDEALGAFTRLIRAIETRLPGASDNEVQTLRHAIDPNALSTNSFAGQFLAQAPDIRFSYIAPGLHVVHQQPFASVNVEPGQLRPLLLFESSQEAHQDIERTPWGAQVVTSPFSPSFRHITHYPAGLYLTETDPHGAHPFEDGCKLILPYAIGGNGWARTSDGALFGENTHAQGPTANPVPRSTELYQLGFNHFIEMHDVQLKHVLSRWADMVEQGKWTVNADGVAGGIEKWREADTEDHWQDYQLPISW
jgi:hypothetical protein